MAEYVDGSEKAPLHADAAAAQKSSKRAASKPDWTRFGLSGGDGHQQPLAARGGSDDGASTRNDDDAGEVNEIYAEHQVCG